jgi:hypothetical protein
MKLFDKRTVSRLGELTLFPLDHYCRGSVIRR